MKNNVDSMNMDKYYVEKIPAPKSRKYGYAMIAFILGTAILLFAIFALFYLNLSFYEIKGWDFIWFLLVSLAFYFYGYEQLKKQNK